MRFGNFSLTRRSNAVELIAYEIIIRYFEDKIQIENCTFHANKIRAELPNSVM